MDFYKKLSGNPKMFLSVTGMDLQSFERLLPEFEKAWVEKDCRRKQITVRHLKTRKRQTGGGRSFNNTFANRLLMLLVYYRLYVTQEFMTLFFKADNKSLISRNIQQVKEVFEQVLPVPEKARSRVLSLAKQEKERTEKRINSIEEFKETYPELTFLIDGVEQPKQRAKKKEKQKEDYSGKKKRHTRKQIIKSTPCGIITDHASLGRRSYSRFQAVQRRFHLPRSNE